MAARKRDWAFIGGVITCAACVVTLGVAGVVATRGHDGQAVRAGSLVRQHVTPAQRELACAEIAAYGEDVARHTFKANFLATVAAAEPGTTNGWSADEAWDYVRRELPC
ncbi:MAG: hypothetical protein EHM24_11255 [Acidobacteria bacterium]|nr:MAG: hypothetical protein EHM24_11255 [Acidobacteriota bacterium]